MKYTILWIIVSTLTGYSVLAQPSENNCPSPLIVRGDIAYNDAQVCLNDCCLACPFSNNFYEEGKIENTYKAFAALGIISFFLMILLAFIFAVLPSQKQNHMAKRVLLPLSLSVMYFEGSEFFTINKKTQCSNPITPTDPNSNAYCTIQAIFTLGGAYAIASYSALLMLHLHLISVWRTEFITKKILYFHVLIIGGSIAAVIIPFVTNNVKSMNICFISLDAAPEYFYFLSFIYIAFIAHLTTLIYMVHVTIKSNRRYSTVSTISKRASIIEAQRKLVHLKNIFVMQWRALLGALLMLVIYVLNWNYYVYELQSLNRSLLDTTWVLEWLQCLNQGDQNFCASKLVNDVPKYSYIFVLLFFNRTAGILIFLIFAAKKSIILEFYDFIRGRKTNRYPNPRLSLYFETDQNRLSAARSIGRSSLNRNIGDDYVSNTTESATLAETVPSSPSSNRGSMVSKIDVNRSPSVKFSDTPSLRKSSSIPSLRNSISAPPSARNSRSLTVLSHSRNSTNSLRPISSIFNNTHDDIPENDDDKNINAV